MLSDFGRGIPGLIVVEWDSHIDRTQVQCSCIHSRAGVRFYSTLGVATVVVTGYGFYRSAKSESRSGYSSSHRTQVIQVYRYIVTQLLTRIATLWDA